MEHRKIALMFCFIPKTDLGAGLVLHLTLADRRISQADSPKNRKEASQKLTQRRHGCAPVFSAVSGRQVVDVAGWDVFHFSRNPKGSEGTGHSTGTPEGMVFFSFRWVFFWAKNCSNLWNFRSTVGSNSECWVCVGVAKREVGPRL